MCIQSDNSKYAIMIAAFRQPYLLFHNQMISDLFLLVNKGFLFTFKE